MPYPSRCCAPDKSTYTIGFVNSAISRKATSVYTLTGMKINPAELKPKNGIVIFNRK